MSGGITLVGSSWYYTDEEDRKAVLKIIAHHVAEEREACARIADAAERSNLHGDGAGASPEEIAAAIRARRGVPGVQIHQPGGRPG